MEEQSAPSKTKADHYTARLFAAGGVRQTLTAVEGRMPCNKNSTGQASAPQGNRI